MPIQAIAYLIGPVQSDNTQVKGNVTFTQNDCGQNVHVRVQLEGLKEGKHGFHIHEKGDLTNGCVSMGAHYNPDKVGGGSLESNMIVGLMILVIHWLLLNYYIFCKLQVDHGGPDHEVRHVGDLGNIEANSSGIVDITYTDPVITLTGKLAVIGRGVVVHELEDDLGQGNHTDSKKTGNAGGRIGEKSEFSINQNHKSNKHFFYTFHTACGVIGIK